MKKYYATKGRVNQFIEGHTNHFADNDAFIKCVQEGISDLKEPKGFNRNQIRFFTKVLTQLQTN